MEDRHDRELAVAIAEGIVSRADAALVAREAHRRRLSPLAVLVEQGRLSPDSLPSLQAAVVDDDRSSTTLALSSTDVGLPPPAVIRDRPPVFPVPGWDRYTDPRLLGQGGMGTVFAATDPRLRREVAIKFVRGDNPEHARRLIIEARAQARVHHACVCEIYEVGEVDGKVYIAMQYVAGKPLGQLAGELTVEQAAMLVRDAALGLHEAHRAGIIHRDVKPSNILVERSDAGELRPYVVDFGLARAVYDDGAHGATLSGAILGTPRYMAPEQARGGAAGVDRRADVYGLGATLYYLLTGAPPIAGDTPIEAMANLLTTEPRPVRAITPGVPADLEAIVLKCLEKDRADRYDSARALADDLGRFLDGAPVLARPAGVWYRVRKHLARHRRLVAAGAAALAITLAAAVWALATRAQASERERLARRFTEMVERIEAMARYSALSPLHDIRPDQAAMRTRMAELEAEIRRAGAIAAGPGHYALGRGYLALDEDEHARSELETAWQAGYREPRVAYALALALGHLYRDAALAAERIEDKQQRARKHREAEQQLREPALAHLRASRGSEVPSEAYVAALMAYYGGHLDEALHELDRVGAEVPWFYEAAQLRGDIQLAKARELRDRGDREGAQSTFAAARHAYAAAVAIGESVPAAYRSLVEVDYTALAMASSDHGDVASLFERSLAAANQVFRAIPDDYKTLVFRAGIRRRLATYQTNQGGPAEDLLREALADAQRAIASAPSLPQARLELARIYQRWGEQRQVHNLDPGEQLRQAVTAAESIPQEYRDAPYHVDIGLTFKIWADYERQVGADSRSHRTKSIDAYLRAVQIDDQLTAGWISLGSSYFLRASQARAEDPDGDLERAAQALDRAAAIDPGHPVGLFYEAKVQHQIAQRALSRGQDPRAALRRAITAYETALTISPRLPQLHNGKGLVLMDLAQDAWDRGEAPDGLLDQAQSAFQHAIDVAPGQGFAYGNLGEVYLRRAENARRRHQDPNTNVRAALAALDRAIERIPDNAWFWTDRGAAYAIQARYEIDRGRDPPTSLANALSAIQTALKKNPEEAFSYRWLGESLGMQARHQSKRRAGSDANFTSAADAYQKALDLDAANQDCQLGFGQLLLAWAISLRETGIDPNPTLQRGLTWANKLLGPRPGWPDARILRARLLLLQAQATPTPQDRHELAANAEADFASAMERNPALVTEEAEHATAAQQLAAAPR